ncbi:hypothetical protein [Guptibacillus algicola]|uniref:hypothetical protein n=1 Tax=Guptibacillus algicola TaxID=225844 RepID=UPI001CD4734F|nr:hypothetical protein [Alkalihalobacillus algicola]MCA0986446.1 hypothetical protein [Alkalihalobacillus algicola]
MESSILVIVDHDEKQFHVIPDVEEKALYDRRVEEAKESGRDVGVFRSSLASVYETIDAAQHEYKGYSHKEESPV